MIFDNLKNKDLYLGMHPGFKTAFDFIEKVTAAPMEVGKYELDGKAVYAMVQEYEGKEDHEKFEAHQKYIDIQYILAGKEKMESAAHAACEVMKEYDEARDVGYFTCHGQKVAIEAGDGDFAIFYPHDVHKPGIKYADGITVKKIVVKVLL